MDADRAIRLRLHTVPRGQERARYRVMSTAGGRNLPVAYTPARTRAAAHEIRAEWVAAGRPRVPDGQHFRIVVEAIMQRPASHTRKDGSPGSAWLDVPRRPDVDNILKLVLDALQPDCFANDALCREATVAKRYGDKNRLDITIDWA